MCAVVLNKDAGVESRFEFRSFGQNFEPAAKRMGRLSMPIPENLWERHSDEVYIVSRRSDINNVKIRDGLLDIKTLVQTVDGLEQWIPLMKSEFPISVDVLKSEVFPALDVSMPGLSRPLYTLNEFMALVHQQVDLLAVHVHKQRFGYLVNDTICETGIVLLNGAKVETISTESTKIADIKKTIKEVGLVGVENINYLQVIKRVTGMTDKPLTN